MLEGPVLSLFAGIGGFEQAFDHAGFANPVIAYENWFAAKQVLEHRFPNSLMLEDVRELPNDLHNAEIVAAGFPCTDLSPAGKTVGLDGSASGLILGVLRAIHSAQPEWVLLENVPNMLWLKKGSAISVITDSLRSAGYQWAYRVLDAQYFGLNQRRRRVFLLASRHHDPGRVLFRDLRNNEEPNSTHPEVSSANGFYWTEGNRGIGWGSGVVPTIKGSTTASVPSSPGVWIPKAQAGEGFRTPSIEALEVMQGFQPGWTNAAPDRDRWKLVGNAVAVPVVTWILGGLRDYEHLDAPELNERFSESSTWASAGHSAGQIRYAAKIFEGPLDQRIKPTQSLKQLLKYHGSKPLSLRASRGFQSRLQRSNLRYPAQFMEDLVQYTRG